MLDRARGQEMGPTLTDPFSVENASWHPDYIKSRLLETEEQLHLQLIWQKFGRVWIFFVNPILLAGSIAVTVQPSSHFGRSLPYLYGVVGASIIISLVLVYRQYKKTRATRLMIKRLNILYRRRLAEEDGSATPGGTNESPLAQQKRYRDDMPDLVSQFREEANRNRRVHNRFQTIIIVGSVFASAITTASVSYSQTRWAAVVVTALVGLAAGFTGYFKYHERSFNLQQTADAIEREYEAVELRVGRYANKNEQDAYSMFADAVERLRDEQNKRQQQLDQPVEIKREG
jgi:uncharacterized membrane protein YeaQ/YmgE (transglycosylase-associated protein family)